MKNQKIGIGVLATAFGIIFLLVGVILVFWELMWSLSFEISGSFLSYSPHLFEYVYQFVGLILLFVGTAFLVFGIYHWQIKYRKNTGA